MTTATVEPEELTAGAFEAIERLDADLKRAARLMGRRTVRALVDQYYQLQHVRITTANQRRSSESGEPDEVLEWMASNMRRLEANIKRALGEFSNEYTIGQWLQSIVGIGPVISAGLLAHLDIRGTKTASRFWRFAGLDPSVKWERKQRRPWNAQLKTLVVYKAGESFIKWQNHPRDCYGKLYRERKALEIERSEAGQCAEQAAAVLAEKNFGRETEARKHYEAGHLPPAHLHARARRWTAKLFLSHIHHAMHVDYYGLEPPVPYCFEHTNGDHRHFRPLPNWPFAGTGKSLVELFKNEPDRPAAIDPD